MSRVHDALRKAEQEKAAMGGHESAAETDPRVAPAFPHQQRDRGESDAETGQSDVVSETFLELCSRREWNSDPNLTQHVDPRRHTLLSEEFRTLRSRLYLTRKVRPLQKLLITSPLPREGKSFVAANLARVFAKQSDHRVLLIDSDMRVPSLHTLLGAPASPGLSEHLAGKSDLTSIVQRSSAENFFFIPAGVPAANPTELLGNGRFELLVNRVSPVFDWIIVDSPPTIPVSDARLLAGFCDGVLLLVNSGTTPFDLAQRACGEFSKDQLLGVILNRVEPTQNYGTYYVYAKDKKHRGNGTR